MGARCTNYSGSDTTIVAFVHKVSSYTSTPYAELLGYGGSYPLFHSAVGYFSVYLGYKLLAFFEY